MSNTAARSPAEANFRWNFSVNTLDISFYMLAMNLASQSTILPLLITQLTSSKLAVGVAPALWSLGFLLPQMFTAGYTEGLKRKKPFIMAVSGVGERLPWLVIGLAVGLFGRSSPGLALGCLLVCMSIASLAGGVTMPAWYDMIAKVIPLRKRGLWSGVSFGLGAFMGIAGSALAGMILQRWTFPQSYMLLFTLAFGALMVSYLGLCLNREPDSETIIKHESLVSYLRLLPAILRRDSNYRAFLISRSVAFLGMMVGGFFIVYGAEKFGVSGAQVGAYNAMLVGSQTLMNLLWGLLGDRRGHKIVLVLSALSMSLGAFAVLVIPSQWALWVGFFLLGAALSGDTASGQNIILEFCAPEERPTYIGLTNTLLAPSRSAAPLIGGWLATAWGYSPLFLTTTLVCLLGALMLGLWVREPRNQEKIVFVPTSPTADPDATSLQ